MYVCMYVCMYVGMHVAMYFCIQNSACIQTNKRINTQRERERERHTYIYIYIDIKYKSVGCMSNRKLLKDSEQKPPNSLQSNLPISWHSHSSTLLYFTVNSMIQSSLAHKRGPSLRLPPLQLPSRSKSSFPREAIGSATRLMHSAGREVVSQRNK